MTNHPSLEGVPDFYHGYVKQLGSGNILNELKLGLDTINQTLNKFNESTGDYRYESGKWSVKEVIGHMIDTERVMTYRALCIARGEEQSLPGFDQDVYAKHSNASTRRLESLSQELNVVRSSSIYLFESFTEELLDNVGNANGYPFTARVLGYVTVGHAQHHINILEERYC